MPVISLRHKILFAFTGCAVAIALLFGLCSLLFAYHTEDRFFESLLQAEANVAEQQLAEGAPVVPRLGFIRYYPALSALPAGIGEVLKQTPNRREFAAAQGKHFHLIPLSTGYLLADVSEQLIVRNIRGQMFTFLLCLLLAAIVFSAVLAFWLARRVLKPLHQLTAVVDNAGQHPTDTNWSGIAALPADEIGRLAQALQQAWSRVAEFISREQQFTQDVSHELRTPVTVSRGAITLLRHTKLTAQQLQLIERLELAQQQIAQSIETLMLLAREQQPAASRTPLLPLVEHSILQQQPKLAGKQLQLNIDIAADESVMIADSVLLILLNNLLGNAFEYTVTGHINIAFKQQTLTVEDTGGGIDAAIRQRVFDSGVKGENSQGMGVGLSLVKRLCDKWHIGYHIQSDSSGTRVRLQFPAL